jgi:hypothetical protein
MMLLIRTKDDKMLKDTSIMLEVKNSGLRKKNV